MAFIRNCITSAVLVFCGLLACAQTVYYPSGSSRLLKSTAADAALLLQKAIPGSHFNVLEYSTLPATGIVFIYDTAFQNNGSCKVEGNGSDLIKFTAAQDNGLTFGIYRYLQQCGFRFYQPGSIWEIIPVLSSPYRVTDTIYSVGFKYQGWFISGGHNLWAMDNDPSFGWDTYFGADGHNWALYQRRNGMTGAYRFTGHRGDLMSGSYLATLQQNPCYVACYNGSRIAGAQSVPDIRNIAAKELWSNTIGQQYTNYQNVIYGSPGLYADYYRNFNFNHGQIGIEVPDGAKWGNSQDNSGCSSENYPGESDQHFTLANFTVQKLGTTFPGKQFQLYAYSTHANVPSFSIDPAIDVQVIPTAFQNESSAKGLLSRWYGKTRNISEYHYLNIPQWGGETPMFFLNDLRNTLLRAREKNSQGVVWEASPAKFASLPFLLAANNELTDHSPLDSSLRIFCKDMFAGAAGTMYDLLQMWGDDKTVSIGTFIQDNKYKLPLYLQMVQQAVQQTQNAEPVVKERIRELMAYLHYMVLYYDWIFDQRSNTAKADKAGALCIYLARINKLQLVNSYFLIADITSRYPVTGDFNIRYNVQNGTAYQNGSLPLITANEIDADFERDLAGTGNTVQQYSLENAASVKSQFARCSLKPLHQIEVKILYTIGTDYPNRSEFYINAPAAGNFSIQYTPHFDMPGKGYINFTVEDAGEALGVVKDFSIAFGAIPGSLTVNLPKAGTYKFSVVSKYKSGLDLVINTNGNYFYRNGPFLGNKTENYRGDLLSLPGYFFVPANVSKLFFSVNNSNAGGNRFASADAISKTFMIKDNHGNAMQPHFVSNSDSALLYLDVPAGSGNSFWQVSKMEQYNLCFASISNLQWYAEPGPCTKPDFSVSAVRKKGECITELTTLNPSGEMSWEVTDSGKMVRYEHVSVVDLPAGTSPNAIVTLTNGSGCSISKRLGDDDQFISAKRNCLAAAALPGAVKEPVIFPNPSNGIFNFVQNGTNIMAHEIIVRNAQGIRIGIFRDTQSFNISNAPAGLYLYTMCVNGTSFTGKLVKL